MDKMSIFWYFNKPKLTITEQNSHSANSTSNQISLTANCVNEESTIPKSVEQPIKYTVARISDLGRGKGGTFSKKLLNKDFLKIVLII